MRIRVLKGLSGYLKGDTSKPFRLPPGEHTVPDWLGDSLCSAKQAVQLDVKDNPVEEVKPAEPVQVYAHVPEVVKEEVNKAVVKRGRRKRV
jgi:hypothetical protein